jgi:hypothetical protein
MAYKLSCTCQIQGQATGQTLESTAVAAELGFVLIQKPIFCNKRRECFPFMEGMSGDSIL